MSEPCQFPFHFMCPFCKKPAFLLSKMPENGDVLTSRGIYFQKTQRSPKWGEVLCCDECGMHIPKFLLDIGRIRRHEYV